MSALTKNIIRWFDSEAQADASEKEGVNPDDINWVRCMPFVAVHLACFSVIWVGWSPVAVVVCMAMFWLRMFAITAFYHRYFSHRSFKSSRACQFVFACIGSSAAQRGPLWWASHHRKHHKHSDTPEDLHSPVKHGFWWSHVGWFMSEGSFKTDYSIVQDLARYPELRFLNRFDILMPAVLACLMFLLGVIIAQVWPESGTSGGQMFIWGFFISTVILFHATFTINSLGHVWGSRRFKTRDHSRNNPWLAFVTLGEGWHNNHHRYAISARQGFYWWELDLSYLTLKFLSWFGIVSDLNTVPARILEEGKHKHLARSL